MSDDNIHACLQDLCTKVGGLTSSVCDLRSEMAQGRSAAIERHTSIEKTVSDLSDDVREMKPHVEQFVLVKKHIVRAAVMTILTSVGLNADSISHTMEKIGGMFR